MKTEKLLNTKEISYEEWKKSRMKGIGGSDAAAIVGLNRYKSPLRVYLEKIGEAPEVEDNERMYWGRILENLVAKEFEKRTGKKVRRVNAILQHPEYDFMIANIDRRVVGENAILECKTTSQWNEKEWKDDEVPQEYIIQVQHYMAVTGTEKAYIAVLIGGNKFLYKEIERDEELIDLLIEKEKEFWKMVEDRTPPVLDGSKDAEEILKYMYPNAIEGTEVVLPDENVEFIERRKELDKQKKELESNIKAIDNRLKQLIGENEKAKCGTYILSYKNIKSSRFDTKKFKKEHDDLYKKYIKETFYRKFEIKEVK
ncbi:hypothetical protein X275_01175 [Marinitoga sp. 1197]|uniref:YqaJ viral recombinase family nuclease n=1 Tax=unclassified Marinitoga TaxID=2640159 RepID=UPI000640E7D9|nr:MULTISPECIES: YqaJ viral recombinase family protein [unclassified Marinitoga]AJW76961.1 recombination-related protein [Marinitoga camini virus 1]AMS33986.1 YqaJ-like viral recombinase [Marinitoga camini virus 2]KLO23997.1 hypothetical protein X275_01175 [Marinitoga sp. 1197]KLO24740.1 hypothetical protein X274_02255 [Marinitoga sp. 1155]